MKQKVIGIRADGNASLGMGHLMRCSSIAKALETQDVKCIFFTADVKAADFLIERGFTCESLNTDYQLMEAELSVLKKLAKVYMVDMWLVDSYQITQKYLDALREICPVFYMDDTAERILIADGLINYNSYGDSLGYENHCPKDMTLLLGAKYAPVKEAFSKVEYQVNASVRRVLITMGGSDTLNIAGTLCEKLLDSLPQEIEFTLICGKFNPHMQMLLQLQERCDRVKVLVDVQDMWNKLATADIVVSAAGSTLYEVSTIGVPAVCCYYVGNQRQIAESFAEKAGICNAGDYSVQPREVLNRLTEEIGSLVTDFAKRKALSERIKLVTDGMGAARLANALFARIEN